jgi:hypothetical protein
MIVTKRLKIKVCSHLAGQDRPILSDRILMVSPAMGELLEHADANEMEHLLQNLLPIEIPGLIPKELTCQPTG